MNDFGQTSISGLAFIRLLREYKHNPLQTAAELAEKFNISAATVAKYLKRMLDEKRIDKIYTALEVKELRKLELV